MLSDEEWMSAAGESYIYVNVHVVPSKTMSGAIAGYGYRIDVEMIQRVQLLRDPTFAAFATTWSVGVLGFVQIDNLRNIRASVSDMVDEFINACLSVNPKDVKPTADPQEDEKKESQQVEPDGTP